MIDHAYDCYPYEACGLLAGPSESQASVAYPMTNASGSAKVYSLDPKEFMQVDRRAEENGLEILGVFHSHTHTQAYPSPTDVASAGVEQWHYVLVSLEHDDPSLRSFKIANGNISEETVVPFV